MKTPFLLITLATFATAQLHAADTTATAANAINALGIDLLKTTAPGGNALLSPYSIQNALAMTYAGASGKTRDEMSAALHFPKEGAELDKSFAALNAELTDMEEETQKIVARSKEDGGPTVPVTFAVANRLYGQTGYDFRPAFLNLVAREYGAPLQQVDFVRSPDDVRKEINAWVSDQTHKRIGEIIPEGGLDKNSRLVLVNAVYLKAAWSEEFVSAATQPDDFHVGGGDAAKVPTMRNTTRYGYAAGDGFTAVTLPYVGNGLQFTILLPDKNDGLAALEAKLTPAMLAGCANLKPELVALWLPKLKLQPGIMELGDQLQKLGVKTAFDIPQGSADFDAMAPRKPGDYLFISQVFHRTWLALDEHGTEAAAATAVAMKAGAAPHPGPPPKIYEVHVDHPFLFAIQDRKSGACLFLGRVTDPR